MDMLNKQVREAVPEAAFLERLLEAAGRRKG